MLEATLVQSRTKSPSHKGGVGEEVEGVGGHFKPENHPPGACDPQGRMLCCISPHVGQGISGKAGRHTVPPLWDIGKGLLFLSLSKGGEVSSSLPLLLLLKELPLCFDCTKSTPTFFCFQR